ncbi:MAG TPA: hypothetical protein VFU27_14720 [Terriglobales bacterium]|nr:hypothetical protein [Terriglobales bacterium]
MLAEHTTEELELWSQLKKQVVTKIHESDFAKDIEWQEIDGQFILLRRKPPWRGVIFSFSSPNPLMYVHFENDNAPPRSPLMLRVEGNRLGNAASDKGLTVEGLVTNVLAFLLENK